MGKKKHKKVTRLKDRSDSEIIQAAERAEKASKLKEAAEFYKELNKRYPAKYDDSLIRVQIGRYEAFIQNQMYESAKQLVVGLGGLISDEKLKALELRIAVTKNDKDTIDRVAWEGLSNSASLDPKAHLLLLESLIFSDSHPPESLSENSDVQTLFAVREGFVAICAGDQAALSNTLSKIPRSSVLAHWKLLLRALEAWYAEEEELLDKCLRKLTDIEGKGAQIVRGLELLRNKDCSATSQSLNSALGLHGIGNIGDSLMKIDEQVSRGDLLNAFKYAQKQFPRFTGQESDVDQLIVEGFVSLYQKAPEHKYHQFIDQLLTDEQKSASLRLPFMRANYRDKALNCACFDCMLRQGEEYLSALEANGITSKERAHLKYHLADRLVNEIEEQFDYSEGELEACSDLLQEAREEDPAMIRAGLLLAKCYLSAGAAPKGNALLDELAKEFPEDPAVLFAAGRRCIERKTYVRGLRQLEQAYAIDPHLPELEATYVKGLLAYALQCYRKNLLDKGRMCFEKMKPYLRERSDDTDFTLGSRWMRLRQLEMEASYGDPTSLQPAVDQEWRGKETLREAFAHLISEQCGSPERIKANVPKLDKFFRKSSLLKKLDPNDVCTLQAFIEYSRDPKSKRTYAYNYTDGQCRCFHFIKAYSMSYAPERLEGILKLLWSSIPDYLSPPDLLHLTKLWSKADRRNPQLKLMHIMALRVLETPTEKLIEELDKATDTARSRGDEFALRKASELRKDMEKMDRHRHLGPMPLPDYRDDTDAEDADFAEDDYPDEDAPPEELLESMYQCWQILQYEERKDFEADIKRKLGKAAGRALINGFKERMKADKQASVPTGRKQAEKSDTNQLDLPFNL